MRLRVLRPLSLMLVAVSALVGTPVLANEATPEPSVPQKVEAAVVRGAHAAASGVERGVKAAANGIERGAKATSRAVSRGVSAAASGVERGARATERVARSVAHKVGPAPSAPGSAPAGD